MRRTQTDDAFPDFAAEGDVAPSRDESRNRSARSGLLRWALTTVIWPWLVSRALVGLALLVAHQVASGKSTSSAVASRVRQGLLGWDAGWYESIARHGYWGAGHASLRFFPLVPALARAVSLIPGLSIGTSLLLVTNLSTFFAVAWLALLVRRESADQSLARRAAWLVSLAPPAFTLVMGYAEGTLLLLAVGTFFALRTKRWWWAALLGLLAGTCRPLGVLLALPALVEIAREWASTSNSERLGRLAAVAGPAAGFGAFLGWVGWRYGNPLTPLKIQEQGAHRGAFADPFRTLAHDASLLFHGHHLGTALHLPWVVLALVLLIVSFWRWPFSYGLFAAAVVAVSLSASNLDGFERYALSAFPLVLAAASLTANARVERIVLVLSGSAMVGYALLAFLNAYVP